MKVQYVPGYAETSIPKVIITGKYLIEMGFDVSQRILVDIEKGRIVITAIENIDKEKLR